MIRNQPELPYPHLIKPAFIPVAELQRLLSIGRTTAFRWIGANRVRSVLAGRKRLVLLEDVERLILSALETGRL
jgi:hypothetical protein